MFDTDGPIAREIADLWWLMLALGAFAFVVFTAALVAGIRSRDRSGEPDRQGAERRVLRRWVVGGGVVMPAILLTAVLVFTVDAMRAVPATAPSDALVVEVVGHRWWYEVRYPAQGIVTANEMHLPVGRPVAVRLTSADVIHSLWVPALGGKMDLLPDDTNVLTLEADEPGEHRTQCAEFCGLQHARMGLHVVVEPEAAFSSWLRDNRRDAMAPADPRAARGSDVFLAADCGSCHTVRGTSADGTDGPDLTHIASRESIGAATVPRTRQNMLQWIRDPHEIKRGVLMPATSLTEEDMAALLAYLAGLR